VSLNWRAGRPTLIRTDPIIARPRNPIKLRYLQAALRPVDRLIVWSPAVIERYARCLGVPRKKMIAQRFHHTLGAYDVKRADRGDYIFSGGDSMRDYLTLMRAVKGLAVRVVVATRLKFPGDFEVPPNVTIKPVSAPEFRELMGKAYLVVFPLGMDNLRTSGQQSYLNAMAMGKAVIVTDTLDAPFYIEDNKTGILVPSGDAAALREALVNLLDRTDLVRDLGEAARTRALPMDQEFTWTNILRIAIQTHQERLGFTSPSPNGPLVSGRGRGVPAKQG
jgi:glycosyltransferase involved in cell wall biosynthesis